MNRVIERRHDRLRAHPEARARAAAADAGSVRRWASLGTWWLVRTVPAAFVPEEDEGYFITVIQAPAGASLGYTTEIAKQVEAILFKDPDILAAFSVVGFSFSGAAPNNGLIFTRLKDYDERPGQGHSLQAVLGRIRGPLMGITGGARHPVRAARDPGPVGLRWLPVRAARPDRRRHLAARRDHGLPDRGRQPERPGGRACSRASAPTTRSSWSTSTATRRAAWTCRCAR